MSIRGTKVGEIGVDAGLVWIGDPCYILHKSEKELRELEISIGENWGDFCGRLSDGVTPFNYPLGHGGLGVCVSTPDGDGTYPILAEYENGRLARIVIDFTYNEDEEN